MKKRKVIFYTDCYLFGGCERPIFEMMFSEKFYSNYNYLFIFRSTEDYKKGVPLSWLPFLRKNALAVYFFDIWTFNLYLENHFSNVFLSRFIKSANRILYPILRPFLFLYDFLLLFFIFLKEKGDFVHINNGGYPASLSCRAACIAAKCAGKKNILLNVHNTAFRVNGIFERIVDFLIEKSVSVFITGSKATGFALSKNRGFKDSKITNVYYGIRPALGEKDNFTEALPQGISSGIKYISMVAVFEERKGHKYVVFSFKKLITRYTEHKNVKLLLMGDGPLLEQIKNLVVREGLSENVLFLNYRENYMDYIASSLFLVNPSLYSEDLPYVVIEAMAMGIPVIGTDVAGIPEEIEDGVNGIIVPPADTEALVQAMLLLVSDNAKRQKMGQAAKERYLKFFSIDKMVENYLELYQKLEDKQPLLT